MNVNLQKKIDMEALVISIVHSGKVAIPTVILSFVVVLTYCMVLFFFAIKLLSPLLTILILAGITFASYVSMHEAVHGNIGGKNHKFRWLDKSIGHLMAPIIAIPFTSHKEEHLAHHKYTNTGADPDVHIKNLFKSPKDFYKTTIRVIKTQNTFFVNNLTRAEIGVSIGWRLLFIYFTGLMSIPVLFFGWFLGAFLTIYLLTYLPHKPYEHSERWKNTNIQLFPIQWLENIIFQQNLHAIHHLFPRVPFYNYRKVFEKIEPSMRMRKTPIVRILDHNPL